MTPASHGAFSCLRDSPQNTHAHSDLAGPRLLFGQLPNLQHVAGRSLTVVPDCEHGSSSRWFFGTCLHWSVGGSAFQLASFVDKGGERDEQYAGRDGHRRRAQLLVQIPPMIAPPTKATTTAPKLPACRLADGSRSMIH